MFSFIPKFSLQSSRKKLEKKKTIHQIAFSFQSLLQQLQPSTSFFVTFTPTLTPDKKKRKGKKDPNKKRDSPSLAHTRQLLPADPARGKGSQEELNCDYVGRLRRGTQTFDDPMLHICRVSF